MGLRTTFDLTTDLKTSQPEFNGEAYYDRTRKTVDIAASFEIWPPKSWVNPSRRLIH